MRYADDAVLIAENKEDLPQLLDITEEESRRKGYGLKEQKIHRSNGRQSKQCVCTDQFLVAKGKILPESMQILGALECEEMDTTTVKSHQKRHWSVLLNPSPGC